MDNPTSFFMMAQPLGGLENLPQESLSFLSMNNGIHGAYIGGGPNLMLQGPHTPVKTGIINDHTSGSVTMTKPEQAEMYKNYLAEEGYLPKIDSDGDVAFKCEGRTYVIIIDPDDDTFFHLSLPCFWSIASESERARVEQAALYATSRTKVAKVYQVKDNTVAAVEMFCSPPETFKTVFPKALRALQSCVLSFRSKMSEEQQ